MAETLKTIRDNIYNFLNDNTTNPISITTIVMNELINKAIDKVARFTNVKSQLSTFNINQGIDFIDMDTSIGLEVVKTAYLQIENGTSFKTLERANFFDILEKTTQTGKPEQYFESGDNIIRLDKTTDQSYTLRFFGAIVPADLVNDADPFSLPLKAKSAVDDIVLSKAFILVNEPDLASFFSSEVKDDILIISSQVDIPDRSTSTNIGIQKF